MVLGMTYIETSRIAALRYDHDSECAILHLFDGTTKGPVPIFCSEHEYRTALESLQNYHGNIPPKKRKILRWF
jgi:hypothetical protein